MERFWNDIPVGKENAITYPQLCALWGVCERQARAILHDLSGYDSGDDYILIRSSGGKGFYKSDDLAEIKAYKRECLSRGRNVFAPIKKINRVLTAQDAIQYEFENNLRVVREGVGLKQGDVCRRMKRFDSTFNIPLLSKMENGRCMPTPFQLFMLAQIYGCEPRNLVRTDLY